jgi:hypothetical protein
MREAALALELITKALIALRTQNDAESAGHKSVPTNQEVPRLWEIAGLPRLTVALLLLLLVDEIERRKRRPRGDMTEASRQSGIVQSIRGPQPPSLDAHASPAGGRGREVRRVDGRRIIGPITPRSRPRAGRIPRRPLRRTAQHVCYAYAGEQFLNWLANWIIGPAGLLAIVVALVASMLRPEFVTKALYAAVICIVVFFVIREGDTIINLMRSSGG